MINYNLLRDFRVTSEAVSEPVDLSTAKKWLRIEFTQDDNLIQDIIRSVRMRLEKISGLSFGYKEMTALIDVHEPNDLIELPYGPVDDVVTVEERISVSTWDTLTESTETVIGDYELFGSWNSSLKLNNCGLFRFVYRGGFSELPDDLMSDMKVLIAWYYENRGHVMKGEENNSDQFPGEMTLNAYKYKRLVI